MGGGSARGPLCQFHMLPIGRRRRWREVVERAQFNAQLRQLRDPVAGDNIGMALTKALHHVIETELDPEQRPAHHFVNFAITAHGFTHAYQTANFTVKNRDALCCARAIVTMRAHCHKDQGVDELRQWHTLKKGYPVQQRQAQELHRELGVAGGPCGLEELRQFQQALGPQYQLLVMTRLKLFFLIFKGPAAPHQIRY